jgi:hypothetical protein
MPRHGHHPSSEPRPIVGTVTAERPTCHLCSWVWTADGFVIRRPSLMCADRDHRNLLTAPVVPLEAWLTAS